MGKGWGLIGPAGAEAIISSQPYGAPPSDMPVVLEGVACVGTEASLAECAVSGTPAVTSSAAAGYVAVRCRERNYAVQLRGGSDRTQGRLEVYLDGKWGTVCSLGFDASAVDTVCRQLGFTPNPQNPGGFFPFSTGRLVPSSEPRPAGSPNLVTLRWCPADAASITQCNIASTGRVGCADNGTDVTLRCYTSAPIYAYTPNRAMCASTWSDRAGISPAVGSTALLVGQFDVPQPGQDATQDVLLVSYGGDGTLTGRAAFGRAWSSTFSTSVDVAFGPMSPAPEALLLADMNGDGRDDLVAMTTERVMVAEASGARGFEKLAPWLDLSATADRLDTTNTTSRAYLFIDVTNDRAADMVFFDRDKLRLAYYPSNGASYLIQDTDGEGITWFELSTISARCESLGEDCFLLAADVNGDSLNDAVLIYLDRVTADQEVYLTVVITSPPSPLTWHIASPAYFPRGACTSPWAVVMGQFVGPDGSVDGSLAGSTVPQVACISSYDARIYVSGLGSWGVVPGPPTRVHVQDVDLDGRDDLMIFTETGAYYLISKGSGFEPAASTARFDVPYTSTLPISRQKSLGETDQTAATVVSSAIVISEPPVEQRCGAPDRVVAYFSNRRPDRSGECVAALGTASDNPLQRAASATHVIFTYVLPDANSLDIKFAEDRDKSALANLNGNLAAINPDIKVLAAIGGVKASSDLSRLVINPQSIERFANNTAEFAVSYGLDGVELSWPGLTKDQAPSYAALLGALSSALGRRGLLLSLSVPPSDVYLSMPWFMVGDYVQLINFQAFDLEGDEVLGAAPYVETPLFSCLETTGLSVNTILASGAPPQKVTLVASALGRSFVLDADGWVGGPGSAGPCLGSEGLLDQAELRLLVPPGGAQLDTEAFANTAPFGGNQWVHFDDPFTMSSKVCFARAHCLGGVGVWDVDGDSFGALLDTVVNTIGGDPAACNAYETPECTNTASSYGTTTIGQPQLLASLGQEEYMLYQVRKSWSDARSHCQALGGDLAAVTSRGEAGVLYSLLSGWAGSGQLGEADVYSGRDVYVWLGGSDSDQEGAFKWVSTGSDLVFTAWAPGQPDGRYGGEDCLAAGVKLAGSSGGGLRQVVGAEAQWSDMGCTAALPFVCQRKRNMVTEEVLAVQQIPWLMNSWLVWPPAVEGDEGKMMTWAEGQKMCRSYGAELPSLTDAWTREEVTSVYHEDLPSHIWLGLRSYGDGELFWSDGSFSTDGVLNAWEPGEFGDAACAIIVGPQGANVTFLAGSLLSRWNATATGGAVRISPPPPSPPPPPPPPPSFPPPRSPTSPASSNPSPPFPPSSPPFIRAPATPPPAAPDLPDSTLFLSQGVYSLSCQERMPVVCQRGAPDVSSQTSFYCLTRPNGLAYMVAGERLPNTPLSTANEADCAVSCMVQPRCVYYIYLPNWRPADWTPPDNLDAWLFPPNSCYLMGRPWTTLASRSFVPKRLSEVTKDDRLCFRTDTMFAGDTKDISSEYILDPPTSTSPLFGLPAPRPNVDAAPFSLLCDLDSPSPLMAGLSLVAATATGNAQDVGIACGGFQPGADVRVAMVRSPGTTASARADCGPMGVAGIAGAFDARGICALSLMCNSGAVEVVGPTSALRPCGVSGSFSFDCPPNQSAYGLQGTMIASADVSVHVLATLRLACAFTPALIVPPPPSPPPPSPPPPPPMNSTANGTASGRRLQRRALLAQLQQQQDRFKAEASPGGASLISPSAKQQQLGGAAAAAGDRTSADEDDGSMRASNATGSRRDGQQGSHGRGLQAIVWAAGPTTPEPSAPLAAAALAITPLAAAALAITPLAAAALASTPIATPPFASTSEPAATNSAEPASSTTAAGTALASAGPQSASPAAPAAQPQATVTRSSLAMALATSPSQPTITTDGPACLGCSPLFGDSSTASPWYGSQKHGATRCPRGYYLESLRPVTPTTSWYSPEAAGMIPLAGLGGACLPVAPTAELASPADDRLGVGLPGIPHSPLGALIQAADATCTGSGIVQVAVITSVIWRQQTLPVSVAAGNGDWPFITAIAFRCSAIASTPVPAPTTLSSEYSAIVVRSYETRTLMCPVGTWITAVYGRHSSAPSVLPGASSMVQDLGIVCGGGGGAVVTRELPAGTADATTTSYPFVSGQCPAGVSAVAGQALVETGAVADTPGALITIDALCTDTIDHTQQLTYSPSVAVGTPYLEKCRDTTFARGLRVVRDTGVNMLLRGVKILCSDVPDPDNTPPTSAQLPMVGPPVIGGTPYRYECPEGSKVVSMLALMDVSADLLSMRIECDNAPLQAGTQSSLQSIAAATNTFFGAAAATGEVAVDPSASSGSVRLGEVRYISPELVPIPPRTSYPIERSCPLGVAAISSALGQLDLQADVMPVATVDLPAAPAGVQAALFDVLLDWGQANLFCRAQGGTLLTYTDDIQRKAVATMVQEWASGNVVDALVGMWVGATRTGSGLYSWAWIDGTSMASIVIPWSPNEPNDGGGMEDCAEMVVMVDTAATTWNDRACSGLVRRPLCELVPKASQPGVSRSDSAVPVVHISASNGDSLLLYDVPLSWDQASVFCQRRGGALASFRRPEEMNRFSLAISTYYSTRSNAGSSPYQGVWTGLRNRLPAPGSPAAALRSAMSVYLTGGREFLYVQMSTLRLTFNQASGWCNANGGELASFASLAEYNAVLGAFRASGLSFFANVNSTVSAWIGVRRVGWGPYTWVDGTPFGAFTAWASPALGNVSDSCGVTRLTCTVGNATVGYSNCTDAWVASPNCTTDTLGFICERPSLAIASAIVGGRQFQIFGDRLKWADASQACVKLGGTLASFHSTPEYDALRNAATGSPAFQAALNASLGLVHIGLQRNPTDGGFTWTSGWPLTRMSWAAGQPDGSANASVTTAPFQACGAFRIPCTAGACTDALLNDIDCGTALPYICSLDFMSAWSYSDGTDLTETQAPGTPAGTAGPITPVNYAWLTGGCSGSVAVAQNVRYVQIAAAGVLLNINLVGSQALCCRTCSATLGCFAWTWTSNTSSCALYRNEGAAFSSRLVATVGAFSGISGQPTTATPGVVVAARDCGSLLSAPTQTKAALNFYMSDTSCAQLQPVTCRRAAVGDPTLLPEEERVAITQFLSPMATSYTSGGLMEMALYDVFMDAEAAQSTCELLGGTLAEPSTPELNQAAYMVVNEALMAQQPGAQLFYHIGLTDSAVEGTWAWRSGAKLSATAWMQSEPNNAVDAFWEQPSLGHTGEDCMTSASAAGMRFRSVLPAAQTLVGSAHFMLFPYLTDWRTAELLCEANGGYLAFFDDAGMYDRVVDMVIQFMRGNPRATSLGAWFGLNDRWIETEWRYTASPYVPADLSWSRWAPGTRLPDISDLVVPGQTSFGVDTPWVLCPANSFIRGFRAKTDLRAAGALYNLDRLGLMTLQFQCGNSTTANTLQPVVGQDPAIPDSFVPLALQAAAMTWGTFTYCDKNLTDYVVGVQVRCGSK
ncbi:hypothetical protein HXX76_014795 [Chlamydomonas incerta]|uniref:Chitinase n=1 Tax=Chlamydomonas incerta TaxID=51695 RepID=A0A835VSU1_CHLIN|nr:hypothetical protein HXX76_014795 [Chlamydomonas incerta]|eukprot:KAG2424121.1 hypothetical protein HXX76_014795 [Chlamydomonas incerta]